MARQTQKSSHMQHLNFPRNSGLTWCVGRVLPDLRAPSLRETVEGGRRDDVETEEEHVAVWIGERTKRVKIILKNFR